MSPEAVSAANDEVEDGPGEADTTRFAWAAADYFDPALHTAPLAGWWLSGWRGRVSGEGR